MSEPSEPSSFDLLIVQLRAEGYREMAERLDDLLYHTAWTTSSELYGELGLAILAFTRNTQGLSRELRAQCRQCMRQVRKVWPLLR